MKRIGIDVGGTNTDAVFVSGGRVQASVKAPTSSDVTTGIVQALAALQATCADARGAEAVLIGTTHFLNSVVERKRLSKVAAIRIGAPATKALRPFCDWPTDLADIVNGGTWLIEGGHDYDGREFLPLNRSQMAAAADEIRKRGLRSIAVTATFSPLDSSHERAAEQTLRELIPDASITCSEDLGGIGLLERENAALLNASLIELARTTVEGFAGAMRHAGLVVPLFITQNDGTVVSAERAARFPVFSFASGPTNSMRGAAFLSGLQDAVVADVGGTTTDVGQLQSGFPRPANAVVHIGGVRTLFRMPDLISVGLGGGSIVRDDGATIGPDSVGFRISTESIVFGGDQLTVTDVAVRAGRLALGDHGLAEAIPATTSNRAMSRAKEMIESELDRIKTRAGDVTLIAVGGGGFLIPDTMKGVHEVIRVDHGSCANAVGAAIAQVSGEVDQVFQGMSREEALAAAKALAIGKAVDSGADADSLVVVEVEDLPIAYIAGNAIRIKVKVVGDVSARLVQKES